MSGTWLGLGVACVLAAIVGGGLKLAGVEVPVINSPVRQFLLFIVGFVIVAINQQSVWLPFVISDEITETDAITLETGATRSIPLRLEREGAVLVTLERLTPDFTGFTGAHGQPGQDGLHVTLCGSTAGQCVQRQLGQSDTVSKLLPAGPGSISVFNFATSPRMIFVLKIRQPRCLPAFCEKSGSITKVFRPER
mgnify:CR=1 FL=1